MSTSVTRVAEDQVMVEVMTDKATVELPSPVGRCRHVGRCGRWRDPAGRLAVDPNRDQRAAAGNGDGSNGSTAEPSLRSASAEAPVEAAAVSAEEPAPALAPPTPESPPAWPSRTTARRRLRRRSANGLRPLGIDLAEVAGTGPEGQDRPRRPRPPTGPRPTAPGWRSPCGDDDRVEAVPVIGLRRNIAQRMQLAKERIPHFTYVEEIDLTEVERLRAELNAQKASSARS